MKKVITTRFIQSLLPVHKIKKKWDLMGEDIRPEPTYFPFCNQPSAGTEMKPQSKDRGCDTVLPGKNYRMPD
jgi:hypothetical protein